MKDLFRKIQQYEIKIRKAVRSQMTGEMRSPFKGSGLEFDDVRVYQYGDDVRSIDWNVSARTDDTYIKTFKEEKDQAVFFIVDVSGSQNIGNKNSKLSIVKEITSVLALSAVRQNSQVGLLCYSDAREKYIKPNKGEKHATFLIKELYKLQPQSTKTDLDKALRDAMGIIKKTGIVFLVSDFIDTNYNKHLRALAKKHDTLVIKITDDHDTKIPGVGIIPIKHVETGKTVWGNTSFGRLKKMLRQNRNDDLPELCKRIKADYVEINTNEEYTSVLTQLFLKRNKSWKGA